MIKEEYNKNLKRIWRAQEYLDSKDRSEEDKEKWYPHFKKLLLKQEVLMNTLGLKSGDEKVLEGFYD